MKSAKTLTQKREKTNPRKKSTHKLPLGQLRRLANSDSTFTFILKNGFRIILHQIPIIDMVSVYLRVNTGSNYEGRFLGSGISHFLEHCMFLGSNKFPNKDEFSNLIQSYGGIDLNAYTGENSTCYQFSVLSHYLPPALNALHDFISHPLLSKSDIEEERGTIISEMDIYNDKATDWFYRLIFSEIFAGEPSELPIIGLRKLFNRITAEDLREYHQSTYRPSNMILSVVGHFNMDETKEHLHQLFNSIPIPSGVSNKPANGFPPNLTNTFFPGGQRGYWNPSKWTTAIQPDKSDGHKSIVTETSHHRVEFIQVALVWETCDFFHSDNYTLDIISHILASGQGSILYEILKEKLDWVEKISTFSLQTHPHGQGRFFMEFTLPQHHRQKQVDETITKIKQKIFTVLKHIRRYLTQELLDGSKNTFLKSFIDEKEDFVDVASSLSHSLNYYGHLNHEKDYFQHLSQLDKGATIHTVKKYLHPYPHTFLLVPDKIFNKGAIYPSPHSMRLSAHDIKVFERNLEKKITSYMWNEFSPTNHKSKINPPVILSANNLLSTKREKISNGITLLSKKITGIPKACLQLIFPGGSSLEGGSITNGSFNLLSQMFFTSNPIHSKKEIAEALRYHGIFYNSFSGENTFGLSLSFLHYRLPALLTYVEPILNNTRYRESDFSREKKNVIYVLKKSKENSFRKAMYSFKKHFFDNSSYGLDPKGNEQTIPNITIKEIIKLKRQFVTPHLTAHICGDFRAKDIQQLKDTLSLLVPTKESKGTSPLLSAERPELCRLKYSGKSSLVVDKDPGGQAHFLMGYRTPCLGEGDGALKLVSHYLEGIGGPLFKLRSNNFVKNGKSLGGRCYRLGCFMKSSKYYGMMVFYASFRREATREHLWAMDAFQGELEQLRQNLIDSKELERAKTSVLVEMKTQSIKYDKLALTEGLLETYGLGYEYSEREVNELQALTAQDLRKAVNQYLGRDNFLGYAMKPA